MPIVRELNHIAIFVKDLDASLCLYVDVLGGKIIRDVSYELAHKITGRFVYIQIAQGVVELKHINTDTHGLKMGYHHIAFLTAHDIDVYRAADVLRAEGYDITLEPNPSASGTSSQFSFEDAGKCVYEVFQRDENHRISDLENERILAIDHISVCVNNKTLDNVEYLLKDVFKMSLERTTKHPDKNLIYYKLGVDTIELRHIKNELPPEYPVTHITYKVASLHEMHRYLKENGIIVEELQENGSMFARGPDGETMKFVNCNNSE